MLSNLPYCPFPKETQLYHGLEHARSPHGVTRSTGNSVSSTKAHLPGNPRISLSSLDIGNFLRSELSTPDLDALSPRLWLLATPKSSHISSLTHQLVKGRKVVITEKPELHLVWYYDRIFIKPIPKYLLSHAFWEFYLCSLSSPIEQTDRDHFVRAAIGFIRSYAYLILHRSDFELATQDGQRLLPKKVKFGALIKFLSDFERIPDSEVSPRFHYGDLRLSRLNFWAKIFLGRSCYYRVHGQYADRIARMYGPLLFGFAMLSVLMASFQVALAVPETLDLGSDWRALGEAAQVLSTATLAIVGLATLYPVIIILFLVVREVRYAMKQQIVKRQGTGKHGGGSGASRA